MLTTLQNRGKGDGGGAGTVLRYCDLGLRWKGDREMKAVISTLMLVFVTAIAALSPALAAPNMAPPTPGVVQPAPQPKMVAAFSMKGQELAHATIRLPASVVSQMVLGPAHGLYKVCVGTDGKITDVQTMMSMPGADDEVARQIRAGWAFRARTEPICFPQMVRFNVSVPASTETFGKLTVECSTTSNDFEGCLAVAKRDEVAGREAERRILDRFCQAGQAKACALLGTCIRDNFCTGTRAAAMVALKKGCDAKFAEACRDLAWGVAARWDPKIDVNTAPALWQRACDLGSGGACVETHRLMTCKHDAAGAKRSAEQACALGTGFCDRVHMETACTMVK